MLIPGTLLDGTKYPATPQELLNLFASYLTAPEAKRARPTVSNYEPTAGSSVTFNVAGADETMFLSHAAPIAGLVVHFPGVNSTVGQTLTIFPKSNVTATVTYDGATLVPTGPATFSAGVAVTWRKVSSDGTWVQI